MISTTAEFLARLAALDVRVWLDGEHLRVSAPKGVLVDDLREELRTRKDELRHALGGSTPQTDGAHTADANEFAPLSYAQQRLWFFQQLEPDSTAYNIGLDLGLDGPLDVPALEHSIARIIERHAILRTTYTQRDGEPMQTVQPFAGFTLALDDLTSLAGGERAAAAADVARREHHRPFDLATQTPLRARIVRLGSEQHRLVLSFHHIAADGASLVVFFREMISEYTARLQGKSAELPPLAMPFSEIARRERAWIASPQYVRTLGHWKDTLAGDLQPLALPADHPRPALQTFRGGMEHATISLATTAALRDLSRRNGGTLFMALLAVFDSVLYRHSGQADVLVGSPVANRDREETQHMIGMFVNTIVMRTDLSGNPTFEELLQRVRETAFGAFANQSLPFAKLLDELRPERDLSRTPLFQAMFNMFAGQVETQIRAGELTITVPSPENLQAAIESESKFDLTLYAGEQADGIHLTLVYNADLFSASRMATLLRHYTTIVDAVARTPGVRIGDIELGDGELRRNRRASHVLRTQAFVPLGADFPNASIGERFFEVAERNPDGIAIRSADASVTYADLSRRVRDIADAVDAAAQGRPVRVAMLCDHDAEMIAAILGVLEQGSAYVPLDPAFPPDRLALLIEDAQATVLLASPAHTALAESLAQQGMRVVSTAQTSSATAIRRTSTATADSPAYVLYTSGSTGRPKGVVQNHRNVLHHAQVYANSIEMSPGDRVLLVASYTFDAAVMDIFGALLTGATLCPVDLRGDGLSALGTRLADERITIYHSTPTVFRALMPTLSPAACATIRCVILGGEEVRPHDIALFRAVMPREAVFVNGLGPTESTTALQYFVGPDDVPAGLTVPVGYPVAGTDVVLLDDAGNPTPVSGEISIRSKHVALEYWRRPETTADAFAALTGGNGVRVYRTGDLGRRRPDGAIEFLGRRDQQVKIRGLRIEPGEIEAALSAYAGVLLAAVVAQEIRGSDRTLVAFVVPAEGATLAAADLKTHLATTLPAYMVPSAIIVRDSLPVTRTGKIDRKALPVVGAEVMEDGTASMAPRDATEEIVQQVWAEVLNRTDVGMQANFFELGGHSLSATQVIARIRAITGVELPLRTLFTSPTIEGLARAIQDPQLRKDAAPPLVPRARDGDAPLSFSQERMWFLQQLIPDGTAYNMAAGIVIDGPLDVPILLRSFHDVASRHEILRTTFAAPEGDPRQRVGAAPLGPVVTEVDYSSLTESEGIEAARTLGTTIAEQPFDLDHGPLWRLLVARVAGGRYVTVIVMHHIVSDIWSFGVIAREMSDRYKAHMLGDATTPAPLPIQYTDFSVWQREWLSGDRLRQQLDFWTTRLAGLAPLELPTDHVRPPIMTGRGDRRRIEVPRAVYDRLRALGIREGVTPFMTLFAAFNVLLARYTGQADIAVGVPIANRTQVGVESLVGTFVNTLVHRNDLAGNPSFREMLRRVRSVALDAFAHQDLPFERLVREIAPERDASRSPVFQVLFNIANPPPSSPEFVTEPLEIDRHAAQFDIGLALLLNDAPLVVASYNTDLFDGATIERFLASYVALLDVVSTDADQAIDVVSIFPPAERALLLEHANATTVDFPAASVLSLIGEQTTRAPHAVALEFGNVSMTYADLDARANRLANHLHATGVVPGDLVGVCMQRSAELVVALLAVLKAGAAYVPIDPAYPRQRVKFVLDDSRARAIITETSLLPLVADATALVIAVDRDREQIGTASPAPVDHAPPGDAIAYVIYTSGSTGLPKGVEIRHASLANFLLSMRNEPGIETSDSLLAVTTISFDIAGLELYLPLISGATVILASRDVAADGRLLRQLLESRKPTVMQATPATWRALIDAGWTSSPDLKALCGGEALPRDLAGELLKRVRELWNMYGPTETTIWSTTHRVVDASGVIPVGRPIANTRVYVLDANKQPLPRGVPGELYIGGDGLARGYFNRPELTSERFLPDPFVAVPNARMYRTGDKVRLREDNAIEHLGRFDEQVKLRGYRIELGEIEVAIASSAAVRQAAVTIRQDRLAAFVVFEPGEEMTATEVRSHLRQTLPDYMIPSLVVPVESIPLTPNGKIDRKALPDPLRAARAEAEHAPPKTQTEVIIASVWQELLGVTRVSTTDNFFELGGHSLLSMKAVHEIHQKTGWRPDARSLFFQTLGQIAAMRPDSGR